MLRRFSVLLRFVELRDFWRDLVQVPVDFEMVNVNSKSNSEEDLEQAITVIKRNGVALKVFRLEGYC